MAAATVRAEVAATVAVPAAGSEGGPALVAARAAVAGVVAAVVAVKFATTRHVAQGLNAPALEDRRGHMAVIDIAMR